MATDREHTSPADEAPATTVQAQAFTPLTAPVAQKRRLKPVTLVIAAALLVAALCIWFLLSARAVFFDDLPTDTEITIDSLLQLQVSDSHLLRPGTYNLTANAEGYFPYQGTIEVTEASDQRFTLPLQKKPGHLELSTTPAGASVALDGSDAGVTPLRLEQLTPGDHQLTLQAPRHFPQTVDVMIEGLDKTQQLAVDLQPAWGQLTINSEPSGADVLVDGEVRGTTPLTTELLSWGEPVKLQLSGYKSWQQSLQVDAGGELSITDIQLQKIDGLLRLTSSPSGASITVDGTFRGRTPMELPLKPEQSHNITLFLNGYLTAKRSITIPSGSEQNLDVTLTSKTGQLRVDTKPAGAEVYIDGVRRGRGGERFALPARPHRIEVRSPGYASKRASFTPRPGIEQVMRITLLTEAEARWAATPRTITTELDQQLKLFRPEATFTMGASRREPGRRANEIHREVTLRRPFYLATHEVTNAQFLRFLSQHSSRQSGGVSLSIPTQPVVNISWNQAALFCNWLSAREGLPLFYEVKNDKVTGFNYNATGYRLPTEAEWAWAARSTDNKLLKFGWGNSFPPTGSVGNFADAASAKINGRVVKGYSDGYAVSAPVGKYPANSKGLFDMEGNVAEWVNDFYGIEINLSGKAELDPTGPAEGDFHTIRGASWRHSGVTELRLSFRDYGKEPRDDVGFRIARYVE